LRVLIDSNAPIAMRRATDYRLGGLLRRVDLAANCIGIPLGGMDHCKGVQAHMTYRGHEALSSTEHREEPTVASVWHSLAGGPISDEFLEWPADVFALTEVILKRSEVHRFALSPPQGRLNSFYRQI
jgi:hypothetical protein